MRAFFITSALAICCAGQAQAVDSVRYDLPRVPERAALEPPADLWAKVLSNVGHAGRPLGYTFEEMAMFPYHKYRLRVMENLFRDVLSVPRFSGVLSDNLLAARDDLGVLVQLLYTQLDSRSLRDYKGPSAADWGITTHAKGASPDAVLRHYALAPLPRELTAQPPTVKRLLARLLVAADAASPYMAAAHDRPFLYRAAAKPQNDVGLTGMRPQAPLPKGAGPRDALYRLMVAPFEGDENSDLLQVPHRESFEALDRADLNAQGMASNLFFIHVRNALREFRAARVEASEFRPIVLQTRLGKMVLAGGGQDRLGDAEFIVDLGGNDAYAGTVASPSSLSRPFSLVLDLGGDDSYVGGKGRLACGFYGIGALIDLAGDDRYRASEAGLGCGWYGTGLLYDAAGDDTYLMDGPWGLGTGYAGVGAVVDVAGSDLYECAAMSLGCGLTLGVGLCLDLEGNDSYQARDDGNKSIVWSGTSVSVAMGAGYGRRCDSGDGQNLAGGFGILVDALGNDTYHGSVYTIGAGYWWGCGLFEDREGNDQYRTFAYSLGSSPHFAIGCFVDVSGNDMYNEGSTLALAQTQGLARDGSIAVFIDGTGNDRYTFQRRIAGVADLNSIALFWEREGNDVYHSSDEGALEKDQAFGRAQDYTLFRTFRDAMASAGVFLDTGGQDRYPASGGPQGDGKEWKRISGPAHWGYGLDTQP